MNRTQRAIKRQYREGTDVARNQKNLQIEKRNQTMGSPNSLLNKKGNAAKNVNIYASNQKEARKQVTDYKLRVLSEKLNMEVVSVV